MRTSETYYVPLTRIEAKLWLIEPIAKTDHEENIFWFYRPSDQIQGTTSDKRCSMHPSERRQKVSFRHFHIFLAKADCQFHNTYHICSALESLETSKRFEYMRSYFAVLYSEVSIKWYISSKIYQTLNFFVDHESLLGGFESAVSLSIL